MEEVEEYDRLAKTTLGTCSKSPENVLQGVLNLKKTRHTPNLLKSPYTSGVRQEVRRNIAKLVCRSRDAPWDKPNTWSSEQAAISWAIHCKLSPRESIRQFHCTQWDLLLRGFP